MAGSDRLHRRLVFQPRHHAGPAPGLPALVETLELHSPRPGRYRLIRRLVDDHGLCACLQAEGQRPEDLLSRIDAVPLTRQWQVETGFVAAHRTLAEPPRAFHRRLMLARWGVMLRRKIPVGVGVSLLAMAAAAEPLHLPLHSPPGALMVGAPLLLLLLYFLRGAAPCIELPHLPRAGKSADW